MTSTSPKTSLRRSLGLTTLTAYGVGTIVGGGFYALIGKASAEAGMLTPFAFLVASMIALLSALSYGELAARLPYTAGESRYVLEAFKKVRLSSLVGWMVIVTGVVSAATLSVAFAGFLGTLTPVSEPVAIVSVVVVLTLIAAWGIAESAALAVLITVVEVGGLILVLVLSRDSLSQVSERASELLPGFAWTDWRGILVGANIAFFSFVGFEDIVNVAEETKAPRRTLPSAILISLAIAASLYVLISLVSVLSTPPEALGQSDSPLAHVIGEGSSFAPLLTVIGMLAGLNGSLVQIIMASRVAYGMARKGVAPEMLGVVNPRSRTPIVATGLVGLVVVGLALWLPIVPLAKITISVLLSVYAIVNLSLWAIKRRDGGRPPEGLSVPTLVPILGFAVCVVFLLVSVVLAVG